MPIEIINESKTYKETTPKGTLFHPFAYIWNAANDMNAAMKSRARKGEIRTILAQSAFGTMEAFNAYTEALNDFKQHPANKYTMFPSETPNAVREVLEHFRMATSQDETKPENLIRLQLGDPQTGKVWLEENDVVGFVGRSSGLCKIPLLLEALQQRHCQHSLRASSGGGAICVKNVLAIHHVITGKVLYKARSYKTPAIEVFPSQHPDYAWELMADNATFSRHTSQEDAQKLASFLRGHSHIPPDGYRSEEEEFADCELNPI